MDKRGLTQRQYFYLIYIVLAVIILLTFFNLTVKIREDKLYTQKFTSLDLSFLVSTVLASQNDLDVYYLTPYTFYANLKQPCTVSVSLTADQETASSKDCFGILQMDYEVDNTDALKIKKEGKNLEIK